MIATVLVVVSIVAVVIVAVPSLMRSRNREQAARSAARAKIAELASRDTAAQKSSVHQ